MSIINLKNYHILTKLTRISQKYIFTRKNRFTDVHLREKKFNDATGEKIIDLINNGTPFMVARYGSTEARNIHRYMIADKNYSDLKGIVKHLKGDMKEFWNFWNAADSPMDSLCELSGFFPNDVTLFKKFADIYTKSAQSLDILAVWNGYEEFMPGVSATTELCKLRDIEPWFSKIPWTQSLAGKNVLVVHPFEDSIKSQYQNHRINIFKDSNILPEFNLKVIRAVQSIADEKDLPFSDWFEALDFMKKQIKETDFDVAIIGCGAYGFPLAAFVKDLGKQAIHLGGTTQLLFGIKGKGWESYPDYHTFRGSAWISPSEISKGFEKVEGGRYW